MQVACSSCRVCVWPVLKGIPHMQVITGDCRWDPRHLKQVNNEKHKATNTRPITYTDTRSHKTLSHTHSHIHIHRHTHTQTHSLTYTHTHTNKTLSHTNIVDELPLHTQMHLHLHFHTHTHTHTDTPVSSHTHTHKHKGSQNVTNKWKHQAGRCILYVSEPYGTVESIRVRS